MKTFEALISLVVLLSIILAIDLSQRELDDSLYRYQLASDAWRVMQLRGSTHEQVAMAADTEELERLTGLCVRLGEECDDGETTIRRIAYVDGKPVEVRLHFGGTQSNTNK